MRSRGLNFFTSANERSGFGKFLVWACCGSESDSGSLEEWIGIGLPGVTADGGVVGFPWETRIYVAGSCVPGG